MAKEKVELKMERFFENIDKEGLKSRLDDAKVFLNKGLDSINVDILFSSKDYMYNAKTILSDFGVDVKNKDNEDLQTVFKGYFEEMANKIQSFISKWYNLDGFFITLQDGDYIVGDVFIVLNKIVEDLKEETTEE